MSVCFWLLNKVQDKVTTESLKEITWLTQYQKTLGKNFNQFEQCSYLLLLCISIIYYSFCHWYCLWPAHFDVYIGVIFSVDISNVGSVCLDYVSVWTALFFVVELLTVRISVQTVFFMLLLHIYVSLFGSC